MWIKSENSESTKPAALEPTANGMIVRRNFREVAAIEDMPAHWTYEEWQMTADQYDVWLSQQADVDFLTMENDFLTEENEQQQADIDYCLMLLDE